MSKTEKSNSNAVTYRILSVSEGNFFYANPISLGIEKFDPDKIRYSIDHIFDWYQSDGIFVVFLDIQYLYQEGDQIKSLLQLKMLINYHIVNGDSLISKNGNDVTVDYGLSVTLFSIALSTARGYLAARAAHTEYKFCILPILQPGKILKDAMERQTSENK